MLGRSRSQKQNELVRICGLLASDDDRFIKNGVQACCELLETQPRLHRSDLDRIRIALSRHLRSSDPQIRTWTYKLIALLGDSAYAGYLIGQLRDVDMVPSNRTWAVAALARVSPDFRSDLFATGEEWSLAYQLSSAMYRSGRHVTKSIKTASDTDDPLAHQWLGILYGEGRAKVPRELIRELTVSPRDEVSEYALWGLRKNRSGSIIDTALGPQEIDRKAPSIRRWYYRLLLEDPRNLSKFHGLLDNWIESESDSKAREGLAIGFAAIPFDPYWHSRLAEWSQNERDPYVSHALERYFRNFKVSRNGHLWQVQSVYRSSDPSHMHGLDQPFGAYRSQTGARTVNEEPGFRISSSNRVSTCTLVVDVEAFSLATDDAQLGIFEQMLGVLRRRRDLTGAQCLLVGDGAIVVWTDPETAIAPLDVAIELDQSWSDLSRPRIRIGVHSGFAHQLTLNDGRVQFIGDAINKAVRCCSAATPGELVATEEYFLSVVRPKWGSERTTNWTADDVTIKHGESIRVRRYAFNHSS